MTTEENERQPPRLPRLCLSTLDSSMIPEVIVDRLRHISNPRKALGPDGVSLFLRKLYAKELANQLTYIFQHCLQTSTWPTLWKDSCLTLAH